MQMGKDFTIFSFLPHVTPKNSISFYIKSKIKKNGHARAPRTLLTCLLFKKNGEKVQNKKLVRYANG